MGVKHLFDITGKTALITGAGQGITGAITNWRKQLYGMC